MHNTNFMNVLYTCYNLLEETTCFSFLYASVSYDVIKQFSSISVLHYEEEFLWGLNDLVIIELPSTSYN